MTKKKQPDREWLRRCLTDSGFCCRELLGWNFDLDPMTGKKINIGKGGIRADGPHGLMTAFIDKRTPDSLLKVLEAPRGGYKSTLAQGRVCTELLGNPDAAVLYMMRTQRQARTKGVAMRRIFEENKKINRIFGEQKGHPWGDLEWTLGTRRNKARPEPSFSVWSLESLPTGGHYELIILDDLIDWSNCRTAEGLELQKEVVRLIMPLRIGGGVILNVGTRYADGDIHGYLEGLDGWDKLILDAGVEPVEQKDGTFRLEGDPLFEHLSIPYLEQKLETMEYEQFCAQYLNKIVTGMRDPFRRDQFQSVPWVPEMADLSGWLLTDTAVTDKAEGAMSVLAYIGIDAAHNAYLLDLRCGHFQPPRFVEEFFELINKWSSKVNHVGETMEGIGLNVTYRSALEDEARRQRWRTNIQEIPRGAGEASKDQRIRRLQHRFETRSFYVVDTVPRVFVDVNKTSLLWDPEGHTDTRTGEKLPGGELVEQFVCFPRYRLKDIPDAIADIDAYWKKDGRRVCYYRRPRRRVVREVPLSDLFGGRYPARGSAAEPGRQRQWHDKIAMRLWGQ